MAETIDFTKVEQRIVKSHDVKEFISSYHYSKKLGHTMLSLGYYYEDKLIGAITYGIGANSSQIKWLQKIDENLTQKNFFELTRLCIHPDYHAKNLASKLMAQSFEYLKKNLPERKILISYADTNQENESGINHIGFIYQATNWLFVGQGGDRIKLFVDGVEKHSRDYAQIYKGQEERLKTVKVEQKQKYLYLLCDKKTRKRWMKRIPVLPYPKQDKLTNIQTSKIFDTNGTKTVRGRSVKSDTPAPTGRAVQSRTPAPSSKRAKIDKDTSLVEQALELPVPDEYPVLYEGNTSKYVIGEGNSSADIMFVGEAPGYEEDRDGRPFVGLAGQMLRKCLGESNIDAKDVWITNTVKQRPPQNRDPKPAEILKHLPYLIKEINEVKPKVIVLLGNVPLQTFLNCKGITKIHGNIYTMKFSFGEVKLVPIFHPSYVMRRADDKVTRIKFLKDLSMIRKMVSGESGNVRATKTKYTLIETIKQFNSLMPLLNAAEVVDFDLETSHHIPEKGKIICISFSISPYKAAVVPLWLSWKDGKKVETYKYWGDKHDFVLTELKKFFESDVPKCAQAGHLIDIPFLRAIHIHVRHYEYDTIIMHYLLDENVQMENRSLKDFAWEHTDMGGYDAEIELWKEKTIQDEKERLRVAGIVIPKKVAPQFGNIPFDTLWPYSAADSDVLGRVRRILWDNMKKQGLTALFKKISMPVQSALCEIERNGVKIDRERLKSIQDEYDAMEKDVDKQLRTHDVTERTKQILLERAKTKAQKKKIEEEGVNYGATQQLAVALFEVAGLKPVKRTPGGKPSTNQEVLEVLKDQHEIPNLVLQKRKYGYFQKYYGESFESAIREDGRIHTTYYEYTTDTGRLSSRNPNLQNIARDDEDKISSLIRGIFVAEDGNVLVDTDYSQIEFKLLGHYTQDRQMLDDIANNRDIHIINASLIYEVPEEEVTPQQRQDAKGLTYLLIYGGTPYRIMTEYGVDKSRAEEIYDGLFSRYPGAKSYHESMINSAQTKGFVKNMFGRRRRLTNILSGDKGVRGHAERQAINAPIQGLAGDILYIAMIRLWRLWNKNPNLSKMVLTVHDSLTHESAEKDKEKGIANIHREMTREMPGIKIPLPIDIKVGKSLGNMKKLTTEEIEEISRKF